jgi:hypothetical protein
MYLFEGLLKHTKERKASLTFVTYMAENGLGVVKGSVPVRSIKVRYGENKIFPLVLAYKYAESYGK